MPKIDEYNAPDLGLRPSEIGVESTAAAARRVNTAYNEAAELKKETGARFGQDIRVAGDVATDFIAHQEISRASASFAGIMASKTKEWEAISAKADPNDPTVAANFMGGLNNQLDQFRQGFLTDKGQAWADHHIDQFRDHMMKKTAADRSTAAGHAIAINAEQTTNQLSNAVYSDPSEVNVRHALGMSDSMTGGVVATSPTLQGKAGVKDALVQKSASAIVKSAALGYINKNGEIPDWLNKPEYSKYVNVAEIQQFQKAAKAEQRMAQAEARSQRVEDDYNARRDFNDKANKIEDSTLPKNPGDTPTLPSDYWDQVRNLGNHPGAQLDPGRRERLISQGEAITARMNKPEPLADISHQATMDLLSQMRSGKMATTDPIYDRYQAGDLKREDFNFLVNEFKTAKTPQGEALDRDRTDFFKRYAPTIDAGLSLGEHTALGAQKMYAAEMDARRQEEVLRKAGKDPHGVYDPRSPDFFGRPENIAKYQASFQDAQKYENQLRNGPSAAPAAPAASAPKPPEKYPDAQLGADGKWHVIRDGRSYTVNASAPTVPMSQ